MDGRMDEVSTGNRLKHGGRKLREWTVGCMDEVSTGNILKHGEGSSGNGR